MKDRSFVGARAKRGTLLAAALLGTAIGCDPVGSVAANLAFPKLAGATAILTAWDTSGFDRTFDRHYDASGFDRRFSRSNARGGYDARGFDRRFDNRASTRGYDPKGLDLPPNPSRR